MTYYLGNHDPGAPGGVSLSGKNPRGGTTAIYQFDYADDENNLEDDDLDLYVDDVLNDKIRKKTDSNMTMQVDMGSRKDNDSFGNPGIGGLMEDHTNQISKGLSPRLTYRGATTKGPSQNGQSSATWIRSRPGRISGDRYGMGRAPLPKHYEDIENIWSLSDIDPYDNAVNRQNRIKQYIHSLEDN
jgi:hypothetical protein